MKSFENITIIDASTVLAGPSVGSFFAELGATVIKVENPKVPDVTRSWKLPNEDSDSPISAYFSSVNYRKTYQSIDLKNESGRVTFLELIKNADILISNFKNGDEERMAVTDEQLWNVNPALIIGKITGFGTDSDRVAYDLILQAESGFMSMNGTANSGPVKMPVALIDVLAGHQLKEALLIALLEKNSDHKGRSVSVSLYDAAVVSLMNQASNYLMANHIPQRIGSLHPNIAPYGELFETSDQQLITFAIGSDVHFAKLCSFLDLENITKDQRFISNQNRVRYRVELANLLQEKISQQTSTTLISGLINLHVPVGKVKDLKEVFEDASAQRLIREERIEGYKTKRLTSLAFQWKNQ